MSQTRWTCYYHVIWATKRRIPLLELHIERAAHAWIREKSALLESNVLAVNGMPDHVRIAVSIPPKLAVAKWVREVKGYVAYRLNDEFRAQPDLFRWQGGYSVYTVGPKNLPVVLKYIERQKEHHAENTTITSLENAGDEDD